MISRVGPAAARLVEARWRVGVRRQRLLTLKRILALAYLWALPSMFALALLVGIVAMWIADLMLSRRQAMGMPALVAAITEALGRGVVEEDLPFQKPDVYLDWCATRNQPAYPFSQTVT